jgi:TPR repeat protein
MVELGVMFATGAGVPKDEAQARKLLERAAQAGDPRGVANLMTLTKGAGGPADPAKARALLQSSAERNSAEAQYQLGIMNADGVGGPKDDVAARAMFERAAAQNHAGALERMGSFTENGRGGPQDKDAAKVYYEKAAGLGSEEAKAALKRLQCPLVLKDKRGNILTHLCF